MTLLVELRRRNVIRVAIAYAIISWIVVQVAEFAFETFGAPDWVLKSVVIVLLLGAPVTLLFAWAFEITPDGVKQEKDVDRSQSTTVHTGRKLDRAIMVGLVLVGALILARPWLPGASNSGIDIAPSSEAENSIAVLPFADLSQEGDQAFFADGISEEILNVLVRIPQLKVAGRTSSFSFKGRNEDIRAIGAALGVTHVLEGSVRRSGDRLRITAQLIRGEDGFHMWSETYDREMTDIFAIQDEIARSVADQLAISLGLAEQSLVIDRTDNLAAYENYLRARQLHATRGLENLDLALLLLQESTALDPNFAPAWAEIAGIYSNYEAYNRGNQDRTAREFDYWKAVGIAAAERAIELSPGDGRAHAYLAAFYALNNDWIKAFETYGLAADLAPDDPAVADSYAQNLLEVGYSSEALEYTTLAVSLDPLAAIYRNSHARAYRGVGDVDSAIAEYEKAIFVDPGLVFPHGNLAVVLVQEDLMDEAIAVIENAVSNGVYGPEVLDLYRDYADALGDKSAQRALIGKYNANLDRRLAELVGDLELAISIYNRQWALDNQYERRLFPSVGQFVYDDSRWKNQIRRHGILDLWKARGFPEQCREIGDDDFECTSYVE